MWMRRLLVALVPVVLVVSGCARTSPEPSTGAAGSSDLAPAPVAVAGSAGCSTLPSGNPAERDGNEEGGEEGGVRVLPELSLRCLTSQREVRLRDLGGEPMVVNLWATWCGPCRAEMPMLQAAHEDLGEQVTFLGVDTKDPSVAAAPFLEEVGVRYPQVVDPAAELLRTTQVPGLPVTLFIAPDGEIVDQHIGRLDREELDELVAKILE